MLSMIRKRLRKQIVVEYIKYFYNVINITFEQALLADW